MGHVTESGDPEQRELLIEAAQDIIFDHTSAAQDWVARLERAGITVGRELSDSLYAMEGDVANAANPEQQSHRGTLEAIRRITGDYSYESRMGTATGRTGALGDLTVGMVAELHRSPKTEISDTIPAVVIDYLRGESGHGNQLIMNHVTASRIAKADYDYDNFDIVTASHPKALRQLLRIRGITGGNENVAGVSAKNFHYDFNTASDAMDPIRQWAIANENASASIGIVMNNVAKMSMYAGTRGEFDWLEGGTRMRIRPNSDIFVDAQRDPMEELQSNGFEAIREIGDLQNLAVDFKKIIPHNPSDLNRRGYYIGNMMRRLFTVEYQDHNGEWRQDELIDNTTEGGHAQYRRAKLAVKMMTRMLDPYQGIMGLTKETVDATGTNMKKLRSIESDVHRWMRVVDGPYKDPSFGFQVELISGILEDKSFGTQAEREALAKSVGVRMNYRDTHLVQKLARNLGRMGESIGRTMTASQRATHMNAKKFLSFQTGEEAVAYVMQKEFRKNRRIIPGPNFDSDLDAMMGYVSERLEYMKSNGMEGDPLEMQRLKEMIDEAIYRDKIEDAGQGNKIDAELALARSRDGDAGIVANMIASMRQIDMDPRRSAEMIAASQNLQREVNELIKNALRGFSSKDNGYIDIKAVRNEINVMVENFMSYYGRNGNHTAAALALRFPVARGYEQLGSEIAPKYYKQSGPILDAIYKSLEMVSGGPEEFSRVMAEASQVASAFKSGREGVVDQALFNMIHHAAQDPTNFPMHMARLSNTKWGRDLVRKDLGLAVYGAEVQSGFEGERRTNEDGVPLVMPQMDPSVSHRVLTANRYVGMLAAARMAAEAKANGSREKVSPFFNSLNQMSRNIRRGLGPMAATGAGAFSITERPTLEFETMAYALLSESMQYQERDILDKLEPGTRTSPSIIAEANARALNHMQNMLSRMSKALELVDQGLITHVEATKGQRQLETEAMKQRLYQIVRDGC